MQAAAGDSGRSPLPLPILALPNEDACSRGRPVRRGWAPDTVAAWLGTALTTLPITLFSSTTSPLFPQRIISKKEQAVLTSNSRPSPLSPTLSDVWSGQSKLWSPQGKRRGDDRKPS